MRVFQKLHHQNHSKAFPSWCRNLYFFKKSRKEQIYSLHTVKKMPLNSEAKHLKLFDLLLKEKQSSNTFHLFKAEFPQKCQVIHKSQLSSTSLRKFFIFFSPIPSYDVLVAHQETVSKQFTPQYFSPTSRRTQISCYNPEERRGWNGLCYHLVLFF